MDKLNNTRAVGQRPRVALLVQTASEWSRSVLRGVAEYAHEHGPWDFHIEPRGFYEHVSLPAGWHGDGLIVRLTNPELSQAIRRAGLPAVNVSWRGKHTQTIPKVVSDEAACGRLAAEHLVHRSFRSFGYVGPIGKPGYADVLGKEFQRVVKQCNFDVSRFGPARQIGKKHLHEVRGDLTAWIHGLSKPVAIFTWSSETGREITTICEIENWLVPDDVAVLCAEHDMLMSALAPVPLSNIDQSPNRVGYEAAQLLDRMMRSESPPDEPIAVAPLRVVQRHSTETWAVDDPLISTALRFIRDHAHEPIQVVDVRKAAGVSRRVLEHRFSRVLKRSPAAEIRRARMELVKRLLLETELSVNRIAESCGFNHAEVMIRSFRREEGVSPGQFRARR